MFEGIITRKSGVFTALIVVLAAGSTAQAGFIDNSRNGDQTASTRRGTSTLTPWRASYRRAGNCDWLMQALRAQGFDDRHADATKRWTINKRELAGDIILDTYKAFVDERPVVNISDFTVYEKRPDPGVGGAAFGLRYRSGEGDPTTGLHWIQVIRTNVPLSGGDAPGAYSIYLDNADNRAAGAPWYEAPGDGVHGTFQDAQRRTNFWMADRPSRAIVDGVDWQAQVFLATGDIARRTLTIYDGVWWGFGLSTNVPSPGSLALLGLGGLAAARRRR